MSDVDKRNSIVARLNQPDFSLKDFPIDFKDDEYVVLEAIKKKGASAFLCADINLQKKREFVLIAARANGMILEHVHEDLKNDKKIVEYAVENNSSAFEFASEELKKDKAFIKEMVPKRPSSFLYVEKALQKDPDFILEVVNLNGAVLEYVDEALKTAKVVKAAVEQNRSALEFAPEKFKKDNEFIKDLMARKCGAYILLGAHKDLLNAKDVVLVAVNLVGMLLRNVHEDLKDDVEVVLAAVKQCGRALEYASDRLKNNKEVVSAAVKQDGYALQYADNELKNERDIVLAAVMKSGCALQHASDSLKNDIDIIKAAFEQNNRALQHSLNKDFAIEKVMEKGSVLEFVHDNFKNDPEVVLAAANQDIASLVHMHDELRNNKGFALRAVNQFGEDALIYLNNDFKKDKEVALAVVKKNDKALKFIDDSLKKFLLSYCLLNRSSKKIEDDNAKDELKIFMERCEQQFINNTELTPKLIEALSKTKDFIDNPNKEAAKRNYLTFIDETCRSPSHGLQLLGKLMMSLAVVMLGASIAVSVATTGVGLLPAAGIAASVGLFAGGYLQSKKTVSTETELSVAMRDIAQSA